MCSVISSVFVFVFHHVVLFIENDKNTPIWSRVLALARCYSSSELLGGAHCRPIY